jgi:flagellar biosynthesis/type III secretory pathway M-ring protein FliF/YscJ
MNAALEAGEAGKSAIAGLSQEQKIEQQMAENLAEQAQVDADTLRGIKLPPNSRKTDVLVKHIRESVHKDSGNATNVLRTWISDTDNRKTS